jgi:hypothetical protein
MKHASSSPHSQQTLLATILSQLHPVHTLYFPNSERKSHSLSFPYSALIHEVKETALNRICILPAYGTQDSEMTIVSKYVTIRTSNKEVSNTIRWKQRTNLHTVKLFYGLTYTPSEECLSVCVPALVSSPRRLQE